jgi:hypothetical protein
MATKAAAAMPKWTRRRSALPPILTVATTTMATTTGLNPASVPATAGTSPWAA